MRQSKPTVQMQQGFTLLEMVVAIAVFALLAVTAWALFHTATQLRDRGDQANAQLTALQRAYLQMQQDCSQALPGFELPSTNANVSGANLIQSNDTMSQPVFTLSAQLLTLERPTYAIGRSGIERIRYRFQNKRLLREQLTNEPQTGQEVVIASEALLDNIEQFQFTALNPQPEPIWPGGQSNLNISQQNSLSEKSQIPDGIQIDLSQNGQSVRWIFALAHGVGPGVTSYGNGSSGNASGNTPNGGNSNASGVNAVGLPAGAGNTRPD